MLDSSVGQSVKMTCWEISAITYLEVWCKLAACHSLCQNVSIHFLAQSLCEQSMCIYATNLLCARVLLSRQHISACHSSIMWLYVVNYEVANFAFFLQPKKIHVHLFLLWLEFNTLNLGIRTLHQKHCSKSVQHLTINMCRIVCILCQIIIFRKNCWNKCSRKKLKHSNILLTSLTTHLYTKKLKLKHWNK